MASGGQCVDGGLPSCTACCLASILLLGLDRWCGGALVGRLPVLAISPSTTVRPAGRPAIASVGVGGCCPGAGRALVGPVLLVECLTVLVGVALVA